MAKKYSEVFKSIRYAKGEPRGKAHSSTDDEEHYTVGKKEFSQQLQHAKKRAMQEGNNKEMKKDPCWKDYEMVGMKDKNGKKVPNCVPVKEEKIPYVAVHAKKGKHETHGSTSYEAAQNAAKHWKMKNTSGISVYRADKTHSTQHVGEQVEQIEEIHTPGTKVKVAHRGKMVSGKVVRHDKGNKNFGESPFYVVDVGEYESKKVPSHQVQKEEVEQIEEMPGANMDTRAVHKHLRKSGWALTRTKGSHDVYTHPKSTKHIAVPRHKQLKAPLIRGIMKDAQVSEDTALDNEKTNTPAKRSISKMTTIVKDAAKSAKEKNKFQAEPELSTQIIRVNV